MENLKLYFTTYNVGTSSPEDQSLRPLLNIKTDKGYYDFYVIALQEVKAQPQNMLMDAIFDDPWTNAFKETLAKLDYVKIKTLRLQGLVLNVFAARKHLLNLREIESEYTRTGLSGMWGNKGAVSIRMSIYGCSICFVNSHLSAHDNMLKDRISDYNDIIKNQHFHVEEHREIFYHDYVFWMGDLNFRLSEDYDKTPEQIDFIVQKGQIDSLLEFDQLKEVMEKGEAFSELKESPLNFPPTFKYEVGTCYYDHKRKPAWTDRILYRVSQNNYENVTLDAIQKSYNSHPQYKLSDHKPVTADFVIKVDPQVFTDFEERVVQFDKIEYWYEDDENKVSYKITKDVPKTKNDWIGVFQDKFDSLDSYIIYEYVNKSSSPLLESDCQSFLPVNRKFTITFSEVPSRTAGNLVLVYFSQNEDNVQSVLGMSDPFPLRRKESN